jgi:acyl transferase domain-containing protein/predicted hotdog family 3-hydroxylacyl-ACP dehydratase
MQVERTFEPPAPFDIAIVGMSCLLPGAQDLTTYWRNILEKRDLVGEIPADRFDWERWFDSDRSARDKIYSRWGGFMDDVPFDPLKFGIPPAALKSIEPIQLLALEMVQRALEDAGYAQENPYKERTSVILGAGGGIAELGAAYAVRSMLPQYVENPDERLWGQLPEWTEDSFAGILMNVVAGRISNRFDFGGVNFTVDAACASSLSALYLACRELAAGTSDMVISGGVDTLQSPFSYLCFGKSGALSPRGRSRTFDVTSDGIAISEGLASVILKRRVDAERDGDRIYAVIRAVAGGSDGRSKGMTAPRLEGQIRTLERAYAQARFSPATVGLFEAHGTGTALGDMTECQSVTRVLAEQGAPVKSCAIGSVKSMIGHTKCTAGVAGLIKAALSLHYRVLPPTLHVEHPNPKAGLVDGPLYVNSETRPWIAGVNPRRAAVSSFGFGGTNFHAVLEEYQGQASGELKPAARAAELFLLAANTPAALAQRAKSFADQLKQVVAAEAEISLANLAYTWHRRQAPPGDGPRVALVAQSVEQLLSQLDAVGQLPSTAAKLPEGVFYTEKPHGPEGRVAYLFPGQGSQYPDMLRDLAIEFSEVSDAFAAADEVVGSTFDRPLSRFVFPVPTFDAQHRQEVGEALKATDVLQPALGACGVAMQRLLARLGVQPDFLAGHSYGELVALWAAGAFDEQTLYGLSLARGKAIVDMTRQGQGTELGTMLAVRGGRPEVEAALQGAAEVWLANLNSPKQTIVSGTRAGISRAAELLDQAQLSCTPIPVACAFHSPLMHAARDTFATHLAAIPVAPLNLPVYSNTTAETYDPSGQEVRDRLAEHLVNQVRFADEIEALYAAGARIFVEVGPNRVLSRLVADTLGDRPHVAIATQTSEQGGYLQLLTALGRLFAEHVSIDIERLYEGRPLEVLDLGSLAAKPRHELPRHMWLLNGGYIRPVGAPRRTWQKRPSLAAEGAAGAAMSANPVELASAPVNAPLVEAKSPAVAAPAISLAPTSAAMTPSMAAPSFAPQAPLPAAQPTPMPAPLAGPLANDAMSQFQETMRYFLQTQEAVLMSFLGGNVAAAPTPTLTVSSTPAVTTLPETPATPAPAMQAVPAVTAVPAVVAALDSKPAVEVAISPSVERSADAAQSKPVATANQLSELLLGIVSQRTGYPADMLSFDANLEADLGVDSIKKVEIVGAFRRAALPELGDPPAWFMEQVSGAGTLQQILDGVAHLAQAAGQSLMSSTSAPEVAAPSSAPQVDLDGLLVDIVSQRTGYPADMLSFDANLEADLGVDSIKKVEIVGAYRRAALPEMADPPAWFMERVTGAMTLREIRDGVAALVGETAPASAVMEGTTIAMAAAAATGMGAAELESMLVDVVSQRTGYPADMLSIDANLEADLGIDSIKRVEIVGAFRRAALPELSEPPAWFMEEMTAAHNMRAILSGVARLTAEQGSAVSSVAPGSNGHAVQMTASQNGSIEDESCPRCIPAVVEVPLEPAAITPLPIGTYLVTDEGNGLAAAVVAELAARGGAGLLLSAETLADPAALAAAIEAARSASGRLTGVLHLLPLRDAPQWPEMSRAEWDRYYNQEIRGLVALLKALTPELGSATEGSFVVASVSTCGGDYGDHAEADGSRAWRGGLWGAIKTLAKEYPQVRFRMVDYDCLPQVDEMLRELSARGPLKVGYRQGRRLVIEPCRQELVAPPANASMAALDHESVILVTGGARGITAQIVREMAEHSRARFVLLGRSPLSSESEPEDTGSLVEPNALRQAIIAQMRREANHVTPKEVEARLQRLLATREIRATLDAIVAAGAQVEYVPCDVQDVAALGQVVREIVGRHGRLDAIVHGAGIIDDRLLVDKTLDSYDRVVATKIEPLLTLAEVVDLQKLKALVIFSSVSGFFGNPGQVDYAAANAILNRMAARLARRCPGHVVALNWGPWSGAGMVTPEVARQFETRGVGMVTVPGGRRAVWKELACRDAKDAVVLLGPGPWLPDAERLAASAKLLHVDTPLLSLQQVYVVGQSSEGLKGVEARVVLDEHHQPYLADHRIDDKAVLPMAFVLELMAETVAAAAPAGWHLQQIEDVRAYAGIVLSNGPREIVLHAEPIEAGAESAAWRVQVLDPAKPRRPHYNGVVRFSAHAPVSPTAPDIERLSEPFPCSVEEAYDRWLFHGPLLQAVTELRGMDSRGVDALFQPSQPAPCLSAEARGGWLIDPVILDACPQLGMLWSRGTFDTSPLPNRVEILHCYGPIGNEPVEALFRAAPTSDEASYRADVWLIRNGQVVGLMEGLEGAGTAAMNRITRSASR